MKSSRPSYQLRKAMKRAAARGDQKPEQHAHTAGGRDIKNRWEWFERIVLLGTFVSIIIGVIAFGIDYEDRKQSREVNQATLTEIRDARQERRDAAIERSWNMVLQKSVGGAGKGKALEHLVRLNVDLSYLDMSCTTMGGPTNWDESKNRCHAPVVMRRLELTGARLYGATFQGASLLGSDFSGANLDRANFIGAPLYAADLSKSSGYGSRFAHANLTKAVFSGARLLSADFQGANLRNASFENADLSAANFAGARNIDKADFTGAWALEELPPIGLDGIDIILCESDDDGVPGKRPDGCSP